MISQKKYRSCTTPKTQANNIVIYCKVAMLIIFLAAFNQLALPTLPSLSADWALSLGDIFTFRATIKLN